MKRTLLSCLALLALTLQAQPTCPQVEMKAVRLPDMQIPRANHSVFFVNGEIIVAGGHTTGFIPTPTLEYFRDGKWHQQSSTYPHDMGVGLQLRSGELFLAGGMKDALGIGQTHFVEFYDPAKHTFTDYGRLSTKRTIFSATEIDSGKVVIAGNWYLNDAIEMYDGHGGFHHVKAPSMNRCRPYIIRTSADTVIIFSHNDSWGNPVAEPDLVDVAPGGSIRVPLLKEWQPMEDHVEGSASNCFIGNEAKGDYTYLIPVQNQEGEIAVCLVRNGQFSLLPTTCPIPTKSRWGKVYYFCGFVADRKVQHAYLIAKDKNCRRLYVADIDYSRADAQHPAPLTLHYTAQLDTIGNVTPVLTADGNLIMAGGAPDNNYKPRRTVYLLLLNETDSLLAYTNHTWTLTEIVLPVIVGLLIILGFVIRYRRRRSNLQKKKTVPKTSIEAQPVKPDKKSQLLMERLNNVMEQDKLFLRSDLRVSDLASALHTNISFVSQCISNHHQCSFNAFVNRYRVDYARRMLQEHPETRISEIGRQSGFSSEASFFRAFKSIIGITPTEYRKQIQ